MLTFLWNSRTPAGGPSSTPAVSSASASRPAENPTSFGSGRFRFLNGLRDEAGSATLNAFAFLILVVALAGGLVGLTLAGGLGQDKRAAQTESRTRAVEAALHAAQAVAEGGPQAVPAGATASDASSAVNPNWIRADILDHTPLKNWFLPGRTGIDFAQDRSDHGFSTEVSRWSDWFRIDLLEQRMTLWGPWPVNAADEIVLQDAYALRTGDRAAAQRFREGIRRARMEKKPLTPESLRALAAPHSASVAGVFSALPPWNVNYLPEEQLRALLAYAAFGLPDPAAAATALINARASAPITAAALPALLRLAPDHPLFAYLGTVTLVWKIEVAAEGEKLVSYWLRGDESTPGETTPLAPLAREWVEVKS